MKIKVVSCFNSSPSPPPPFLFFPIHRVSTSSKKISPLGHRQTVFVEKCFVNWDISTCCSRSTEKVCEGKRKRSW